MSQESLENSGADRPGMELFDLVAEDMCKVERHPQTHRFVGQQVASADSICSNIEEGLGRETTKAYTHFLVMARGSARETRGRYVRIKHRLPAEVISDRTKRYDAILGILSRTIMTLRRAGPEGRGTEAEIPSSRAPQAPGLTASPSSSDPQAPTPSSPC